ncbi:hypothetical protein [Providencia alcalifaciens]|uniref:hypothetical protein n=1 Tax=Providencia alcalifaciens TaxID=126385 RepID=UPI003D974DF9
MTNSDNILAYDKETLAIELAEAHNVFNSLNADFVKSSEFILSCKGKIIVSGMGKSGHIGKTRVDPIELLTGLRKTFGDRALLFA